MMSKKPKMPKAGDAMKDAVAMPRFGARAMRPGGMAKGGKVHEDAAMDRKLIRKEIARAERMEDKDEGKVKKMMRGGMLGQAGAAVPGGRSRQPVGGQAPVGKPAPGGMGAGPRQAPVGKPVPPNMGAGPRRMMARGGGVETKGKTKGKMV